MSYRYNPLSGKIEFVGISTADGTSLEATINEKVANLVDSAPTTLDTLNELAAALNNDPNFATSIATLLGEKALATDLSSLAASLTTVATSGSYADLTGTPTLANIATSGLYADLSGAPDLSDVATSGAYGDLTGKPDLSDVATSGAYGDLTGKPDLSDVATSGAYGDLTGTPTLFNGDYNSLTNSPEIPAAQVQSDYNQTDDTAVDFIKNKPTLFDGDYNSLTNPPVIPTDNNQLTNGAGYLTSETQSDYNQTDSNAVDFIKNKPTLFDGDYNSLTNPPVIPTDNIELANGAGYLTSETQSDYNQTDDTAVDFIKNKPTIPTDNSQLANGAGYLDSVSESDVRAHEASLTIQGTQIVAGTLDYDNLTNKPTIPTVPTDLSSFSNDTTNFITLSDSQDGLSISTSAPSGSGSLSYDSGIFTFAPADLSSYLVASDLSTYALKTYVDTQVAGVVNSAPEALNTLNELAAALGNDDDFATTVTNSLSEKANTADLSDVATSGAYTDLSGAPAIPAAQIQSDYNQSDSSAVDFIKNKPTLFDGDYNSLTNPPVIPAAQVQSDYNQTDDTAVDFIKNKPTIPTVPTNISSFTNDEGYIDSTSLPTVLSQLTNDQGFITLSDVSVSEADASSIGSLSYDDSTGVFTFTPPDLSLYLQSYTVTQSDVKAHEASLDITEDQITDLKQYLVSTDLDSYATQTYVQTYVGSQGFITDYTVTESDVTDHQAALTIQGTQIVAGTLDYDNLSNKPTIPTVPTALSSFTNDENFITLDGVSVSLGDASGSGSLNYNSSNGVFTFTPADLSSYLVASDLSTYALKTYVDAQVAGIVSSAPETLDTLNELAAALDDDPNFATTVTNQIAAKPNLNNFSVSLGDASGSGSLNYNDAGIFTFTPADLSPYLTDYTVTQSDVKAHEASLAIQGSQISNLDYNTLDNLPTIPEGADLTGYATETYVNSQGFITGIAFENVSAKPSTIDGYGITDAFSGAYADLTGAPILFDGAYSSLTGSPTNLSDFTNDENFITLDGVSVSLGDASGSGSLNYNSSTGVFSFTPADLSSFLTSASLSGLASETYVNTQVANIVSSAPETLNTLNELATALGDDPSFATTISNQIGQKAALGDIEISTGSPSGSGSLNYTIVDGKGVFTFTPPELSAYLTSFEEQDPIFSSSVASGILPQHIQNWNTAYTWGDHSTVGYLTSQTQADFNQSDSNAVDFIKNKPTIPTVPTNVSDFSNDAGYLTSQTQVDFNQSDTNAVDFIKNKPTIPTALSDLTNDENFISAGGLSVSLGGASGSGSLNYNSSTGVFTFTPADLSGFLTTVSYAEVTDKPTIPTNNNELTNGAGYITGYTVTQDDISSLNITEGQITDLGSYLELVSAPSTSKGSSGDAAGDVAMDDNYIYRCTANYTDGVADIWKRVAFSTDTW